MSVARFKHLPTIPSILAAPHVPLIHRDLSWLQFNKRVLQEGRASSGNPMLERAKFIAISSTNLDEFFMIRFSSLMKKGRRKDKRLVEMRDRILEKIAEFGAQQTEVLELLVSELQEKGIYVVRRVRELEACRHIAQQVFEESVLPLLSAPQAFRYARLALLENLQLGVVFSAGTWLTVPKAIAPSYFHKAADGSVYLFFLDDLLQTFLGEAFDLEGRCGLVRLTRDSDFVSEFEEEEEPSSLPDIVRKDLGKRDRGVPVRLQYRGDLAPEFLERAMRTLRLASGQLQLAGGSLCLQGLWALNRNLPPEYPQNTLKPKVFREGNDLFARVRERDFLFHHPYDSFDALVDWVVRAGVDAKVERVDMTIYRTDVGSSLIDALKTAAKRKKVRVVIELRARFDEANNLKLADELRRAGVEVRFGFGALKLHAKIATVTRREDDGVRIYTHLSTGNYNPATARQYTDLAILTAHEGIGEDAKHFFDSVCKGEVPKNFKYLIPAPQQLHRKLLSLIRAETKAARNGAKGRIVAKVNALVDESIIEALYQASQAGVAVELIVRGACSLIPGISGLSRGIKVVSVIDRHLEHSRIYYFESQKKMYLSSADWMPRNFYSRLELAYPVLDERIFLFIKDNILATYWSDNVKARELSPQGTWRRRTFPQRQKTTRAQFIFQELAEKDYQGTPLASRKGTPPVDT